LWQAATTSYLEFSEQEMTHMRAKGFTLIELAVVLAIIAVLAAVLTPVVTNYLEQARIARAMTDAKVIADAVRLYHRDVGLYPIYDSTTTTLGTAKVVLATTDGAAASIPGSGDGNDWTGKTVTTGIDTYLNTKNLGRSSTAALGKASHKPPYIGNVTSDPWGNKFYLTADNLEDGTNWGYVISAGPDGTFDTNFEQVRTGALTVGDDDIVVAVR
jgi:prepilin-type N-terminal cleavage/methylation domain-containing protein